MTSDFDTLLPTLERIANALERMAPPARSRNDLSAADAFVWQAQTSYLQPVRNVNRVDIGLLQGIGQQKKFCITTPSALQTAFRPITHCFGEHAVPAKVLSSRRCTP